MIKHNWYLVSSDPVVAYVCHPKDREEVKHPYFAPVVSGLTASRPDCYGCESVIRYDDIINKPIQVCPVLDSELDLVYHSTARRKIDRILSE